MKKYVNKIKTHLVLPSLGFAILFWMVDIIVDVYIFQEGTIKGHILSPEPLEIYYRSFVVVMFLAFGFIGQKITQRRIKAEETLKLTEDKYKIVAENTYDWEFWTGPDRRFIYTSPSSIRVTGYSPQKFNEDPAFLDSIIHPDDMPAYNLHRKEAESEHGRHEMEFRIHHADGSVRWISHACQPVTGPNGEHLGIRGTNRDITARKQIEAELENNENKYKGLFSSMLNGFALHKIIVDEKGSSVDYEFLEVNEAFERMTGLKRENIIGHRATEAMPDLKKDSFDWIETYGRVALNNEKIQFEQFSQPLGKWFNITAYSPAPGEFATVFEDITERKKIESVLRDNQERVETIFEAVQAGVVVIDKETHIIVYANKSAAQMIGAPVNDILDRKCNKYICPASDGACPITDLHQTVDNSEKCVINVKGEMIPILKTVTQTTMGGREVLVESFVDISERKRAEAALNAESIRRRILIEQSRDGIVVLTQDGSVYEANHRFAEMIGYSLGEVKQLHVWDWEFQYTREQTIDMIHNVGEAGDFFETRHRRKDGTIYDVEISTNGAAFGEEKLIFCVCRDISERKTAERVLRENNDTLGAITNSAQDAIIMMDPQGKISFWNPAAEKILGYTKNEVSGKNLHQLIAPEKYMASHLKAFSEFHKTGQGNAVGKNIELQAIRKDGTEIEVELSLSAVKIGDAWNAVGLIRDITERKSIEHKLKESESLHRSLFEAAGRAGEAIVMMQDNGDVPMACIISNSEAQRITGYGQDELKQKSWLELIHSDFREAAKERAAQRMNNEDLLSVYNISLTDKAGDTVPIEIVGSRIDYNGRPALVGYFRDVTERRMAESELRKLNTALDQSSSIVVITDINGNIEYVNKAFSLLTGYSAPEVLGKNPRVLKSGDKSSEEYRRLWRAISSGKEWTGEFHNRKKNGELYWEQALITAIRDDRGQITNYMAVKSDITERKQSEALQSAIYKISEISVASENLLELYAGIHMVIDELMSTANFYIALYNQKDGLLEFPYFVDEKDARPAPRLLKKGLTEYVLRTGSSLMAPPMMQKKLVEAGEIEMVGAPSIDWVGVPLKTGHVTFGALVVQSYREQVRFGARELSMLNFVSDNIAAAIQRKKGEDERKMLVKELQESLGNIKTLKGLVPICSSCKKIRNDGGYWQQVEEYVAEHTEADFSHGICDECAHKLYPQYFKDKKNKTKGDEVG